MPFSTSILKCGFPWSACRGIVSNHELASHQHTPPPLPPRHLRLENVTPEHLLISNAGRVPCLATALSWISTLGSPRFRDPSTRSAYLLATGPAGLPGPSRRDLFYCRSASSIFRTSELADTERSAPESNDNLIALCPRQHSSQSYSQRLRIAELTLLLLQRIYDPWALVPWMPCNTLESTVADVLKV